VLWVAPLTLVVAVAACYAVRSVVLFLAPSLARMGQLGPPMVTLAVEGALTAIVVFILFALFVPRPFFWYRVVGVTALVLSWLPDIALALGGTPMRLAMRYVGPLATVQLPGMAESGGPPPGAGGGGPPPAAFFASTPIEQVLVLMLLHTVVAAVCIIMLTTLTRQAPREQEDGGDRQGRGRAAGVDVRERVG
jgi:hypothetical protein